MCYKYIFYIIKYLDGQIRGKYTIQSTPPHESEWDENEPTPPLNAYKTVAYEENENGVLYK